MCIIELPPRAVRMNHVKIGFLLCLIAGPLTAPASHAWHTNRYGSNTNNYAIYRAHQYWQQQQHTHPRNYPSTPTYMPEPYVAPSHVPPEPVQASDFWGGGKDHSFYWGGGSESEYFWGPNHNQNSNSSQLLQARVSRNYQYVDGPSPGDAPFTSIAPFSSGVVLPGNFPLPATSALASTPLQYIRSPKTRPALGLNSEFQKADNLLITMHDRNELGSMDMDIYSQQLLGIKKDYGEAIKGRAELSDKRAIVIRQQLSALIAEIQKHRY